MIFEDRVTLDTFNGSTEARTNIEPHENYWKLIRKSGTVVDDNQTGEFRSHDGFPRILVKFDVNLDDYGLENHNLTENSLWVRIADLKPET